MTDTVTGEHMAPPSDPGFILIVDDNPTNLSVLSEVLSTAGFRFRVAMDGTSALNLIERSQPELILLDVQMPGIDGFEVCHRLKQNPDTQAIPVIFATAATAIESKAKGFAVGAVDYISKPFQQEEVLARMRVHLQLKRLTDSLEAQVQERTAALQQAQVQLVQQEKLSSLGEMVAGIAHEINNPVGFIANNIQPLKEHLAGVTEVLALYQQEHPNPSPELEDAIEDVDLEFALTDMAKILDSFTLGTDRIKGISHSLRTFARADSATKVSANLQDGLETTLMILQHRLKGKGDRPKIEVIKSYNPLPEVPCYPGQMNQVFMNLLANSIDALDEAISKGKLQDSTPKIEIETEVTPDKTVAIHISDNGMGVPKEIQQHLFEPLFTTKPAGKGTGLGLAISHEIVVEKHQGKLSAESQIGKGAKFKIELPN